MKDGAPIPNEISSTFTAYASGNYSVVVTKNNCSSESETVTITKNSKPYVSAGDDITLNLPNNSTLLSGTAGDDDGCNNSYQWQQLSGPSSASISNATVATTPISGLVAGTYVFQLTVTDDFGETASATINVVVTALVNYFNYVKISEVREKNKVTEQDVVNAQIATGEKNITWKYFDGLEILASGKRAGIGCGGCERTPRYGDAPPMRCRR